jgi:hypothetical protein
MESHVTEKQARKHLTRMLDHFTAGSILHLLGDVVGKSAEKAKVQDDARAFDQCKLVEHTLVVVGMGIDAATPA